MLAFYVAILDTEEQKDKFTEIYTTYYGMMYQVARAITHDDKLAEDALHETCLELIEKIDSIRTDNAKQLAYYLRMVTRNRTIDFMRKWDRRSALSYDAVDVEPASLHEDAADVVFTVSGTQWKTGAADITVTTMGGTTGLCLPATAVNSDNAGDFVYLVETKNTVLGVQSVLVRLGVTVEERGDGVVRISGALSGQEQIVSASSKPLSAGTEVRIDE